MPKNKLEYGRADCHNGLDSEYRKNSKIWDTSNNCHNCPKNRKVWCNIALMHPKDANGMANSIDPDQTASSKAVWSWSALFAETYLSQYIEFVRYKKIICQLCTLPKNKLEYGKLDYQNGLNVLILRNYMVVGYLWLLKLSETRYLQHGHASMHWGPPEYSSCVAPPSVCGFFLEDWSCL